MTAFWRTAGQGDSGSGMTVETEETNGEAREASRQVMVRNELGLHARPAGKLAQEAQKFACDIVLAVGEQQVDAKSILDILTLAAGRGSEVSILARGKDAPQAVEHLANLIKGRFGEEK